MTENTQDFLARPSIPELLANCAKEDLIHIGQLQPNCYYLEADPVQNRVRACSSNLQDLLNLPAADCIGKSLDELLGNDFCDKYLTTGLERDSFLTYPSSHQIAESFVHVSISQKADTIGIEIEPIGFSHHIDTERQKVIHRPLRIAASNSVADVVEEYAARFLEIAPFGRVLVYQFMDDWSGKVICETGSQMHVSASMLNLHFPASDIPPQARKLYEISPSRIIFDIDAAPANIIGTLDSKDIDLGLVRSRASSLAHLLYLRNLGVQSSFSCSIMFKNQLWGLIACHNYTAMHLDLKTRLDCERLTRGLAVELMRIHAERKMQMIENFKFGATEIVGLLPNVISNPSDFANAAQGLMELMDADGLAIIKGKQSLIVGDAPTLEELETIGEIVGSKSDSRFYKVDNLSLIYPEASKYSDRIAGLLAASTTSLANQTEESIVFYWFRREFVSTVNWAGKPDKSDSIFKLKDGTPVLTPRSSFNIWSEERKNSCRPWTSEQIYKANLWVHNYARKDALNREGAGVESVESLPFR
jgi:chemotaxis family two-component system sensor kinase Cph1